jgi:hypothetical protein
MTIDTVSLLGSDVVAVHGRVPRRWWPPNFRPPVGHPALRRRLLPGYARSALGDSMITVGPD